MVHHGQKKSSGFTRSGLRGSNNIPAFHDRWNDLFLDRGGGFVIGSFDAFQQERTKVKLGKAQNIQF